MLMPLRSRLAPDKRRKRTAFVLLLAVAGAGLPAMALPLAPVAAQKARHFSPTYAASDGSPYSSVYARTFGAGGPPAQPAPPLETSAAPPASSATQSEPDGIVPDGIVYVIQDGQLLSYRAEDYAQGGPALSGAAVPPNAGAAATPPAELTGITRRLYDTTRPAGPIQLVPPQD